MSRVSLRLDGGERPVTPATPAQSVRLPLSALELAAGRTGVLLPWQETPPSSATGLESALGPMPPRVESPPAAADEVDAVGRLREDGLLTGPPGGEEVAAPLERLLVLLAAGDVRVDADLVVLRRAAREGAVRVRSWHRRHPDGFVAASTADGRTVEVTWGSDDTWAGALTRIVTVTPDDPPGEGAFVSPAPVLEVPWELLLASGRAVREGRDDLLGALVQDAEGATLLAAAPRDRLHSASDAETVRQLRRLHGSVCGRLTATVGVAASPGRRAIGLISWLLLPDGWRSLLPTTTGGSRVLVRACDPERFAAEVLAHAAGGRS